MMFLLFCFSFTVGGNVLLSPYVFDPHFYLGTYGDLLLAGITDKAGAESHWLQHGIGEGRYGTSFIHGPTYLLLNSDVATSCGGTQNYECGLEHYVNYGHNEDRLTMTQGVDGMYTLSNSDRSINYAVYTPRFASAVHSLIVNGSEIANAWDHGRELQYALTMDGHGECYNPTEAGGGYDLLQPTTHSKLISISANNTLGIMKTTGAPAFWMAPGSSETSCGEAINQNYVSNWTISKTVEITPFPTLPSVSRWTYSGKVPFSVSDFQIEAPTLYTNGDFPKIYTYNIATSKLTDVTFSTTGEDLDPVIISSEDGKLACGCYAKWIQKDLGSSRYAHYNFMSIQPWEATTNKWSMPKRIASVQEGEVVEIVSYVIVGNLKEVMNDISQLSKMV